ncbi:transmembrane protein 14A isoform X1 [Myotis daubentonii]|uniref:transmembrane protein 14A isoform X1 n=1 Tax=Myotis daubentonii TaxID=98922 RepID=UPI002873BE55|nr:transmembrane protein 14A isoform X1 [Myotis daubentonii]
MRASGRYRPEPAAAVLIPQSGAPATRTTSGLQGHRLLLCPGFPPQRPFRTKLCFLSCSTTAALPMDLVGFGYAAFVTFGSIVGYKRRGSIPSLIAGLFVGLLAGYGAYRVSNDKRDVKVSLFAAFFLATIMGVRFKRSKKIIPAGLVAGLSLMMILRLVLLLL